MKKRLICLLLSVAVVLSFSPLFTVQADAFSTGAKTYVKTKTVTVKPGQTYKMPVVKLKSKKIIQVPLTIKVSNKNKSVTKGGFKVILKNSKGKTFASYKDSLKTLGSYEEVKTFVDWVYFNKKSVSDPCIDKGNYYISFKNTTNCSLKVKYSVKGYSEFASDASFKKSVTVDYSSGKSNFKYLNGVWPYTYIGRIGPGLPAVTSIKSSNKAGIIENTFVTHDGKVYIYIGTNKGRAETVVSVKLKNRSKPYKIKCKIIEE